MISEINCNKFFKINPTIIPDVSINDFTLNIYKENVYPEIGEDSENNH